MRWEYGWKSQKLENSRQRFSGSTEKKQKQRTVKHHYCTSSNKCEFPPENVSGFVNCFFDEKNDITSTFFWNFKLF